VSGNITTRFWPTVKSLCATFNVAQAAAPEDIPTNKPSNFAKFLVVSTASSYLTLITSL